MIILDKTLNPTIYFAFLHTIIEDKENMTEKVERNEKMKEEISKLQVM